MTEKHEKRTKNYKAKSRTKYAMTDASVSSKKQKIHPMTSTELIDELQGIKEISKRMSDVYIEKRANLS